MHHSSKRFRKVFTDLKVYLVDSRHGTFELQKKWCYLTLVFECRAEGDLRLRSNNGDLVLSLCEVLGDDHNLPTSDLLMQYSSNGAT